MLWRHVMNGRGGAAALAVLMLLAACGLASADGWGTIKGAVKYDPKLTPPPNEEIKPNNDRAFCESKGKIFRDEWVIDSKTKGVKNVIVWLTPVGLADLQKVDWPKEKIHPKLREAPKKLVVDQPVCTFMPRVIVLREETQLVFKNSAPVTHNVSISGGPLGPEINSSIPSGKELEPLTIKARAVKDPPIEFKYTIHPWMKGRIRSFKHPYYAVTDEKGKFEIKDAPEGKFRLQVWHEGYGYVYNRNNTADRGIVIEVVADKTTEVKVPPLRLVKDDE